MKSQNTKTYKTYIGTHDSLTGQRPKNLMAWIGFMFSKTQWKIVKNQHADIYDVRVWFDKNGYLHVGHGLAEYKLPKGVHDYRELFCYLDDACGALGFRIILERDGQEDKFIAMCKWVEDTFSDLLLIGGNRKSDWKQLYKFKNVDDTYVNQELVGSMSSFSGFLAKISPLIFFIKTLFKKDKYIEVDFDPNKNNVYLVDFLSFFKKKLKIKNGEL